MCANLGHALRNRDFRQIPAICKSIIADFRHALRNADFPQLPVAVKRVLLDAGDIRRQGIHRAFGGLHRLGSRRTADQHQQRQRTRH